MSYLFLLLFQRTYRTMITQMITTISSILVSTPAVIDPNIGIDAPTTTANNIMADDNYCHSTIRLKVAKGKSDFSVPIS